MSPHDCSSNPFRTVFPQMAVRDNNLMNILLALSASHRARILRQPTPKTRVALWFKDVFPSLGHTLDNPSKLTTNKNLATTILLAFLEITSPNTFGIAIPWQVHLNIARQMIATRICSNPDRIPTKFETDTFSSFL